MRASQSQGLPACPAPESGFPYTPRWRGGRASGNISGGGLQEGPPRRYLPGGPRAPFPRRARPMLRIARLRRPDPILHSALLLLALLTVLLAALFALTV